MQLLAHPYLSAVTVGNSEKRTDLPEINMILDENGALRHKIDELQVFFRVLMECSVNTNISQEGAGRSRRKKGHAAKKVYTI